jgi:hypothetical protein
MMRRLSGSPPYPQADTPKKLGCGVMMANESHGCHEFTGQLGATHGALRAAATTAFD